MGPRRSSSPAVSPTSVIVEFHEFAGRWFVTGRWGHSSGIAVKRSVRKSALGKMVLDQAETARQGWRWRSAKVLADEAELWERFCVGQAGVPMDRYLPEKRIVILVGQAGIRWHDASQSPPNWERLPDRSARRLGRGADQAHEPGSVVIRVTRRNTVRRWTINHVATVEEVMVVVGIIALW